MGWTGLELTVAIQNCSWNALRLGDFKTLRLYTLRLQDPKESSTLRL